MNTVHTLQKKAIRDEFDIIVAGGGLAGVMAAVSASREGMRVLLVEKHGFLGGMATAGLVNPFMAFREKGSRNLANAGLFTDLLKRIHEIGGSKDEMASSYMEEFMKIVLDRYTKEYNIKVLLHSKVCDVTKDGSLVKNITVATISGLIKLSAPIFIDATGNADLSAFAGLEYKLGRESDGLCQPMTLCFRLGNVDWSRYDRATATTLYKEKQAQGLIINPREDILVFRLPVDNVMHLNTTRIVNRDPTDVEDLTWAEQTAREQVLEMYRFMKNNIDGMQECELIESAPEIGIRESRRILGRYEISREDLLNTVKFDDSVARGVYEIDIHNPAGGGTHHERIPENDYYTIPYRAMLPVKADNLIVAGRSISSSHEAHSAFRVMPITTCIGEGAGVAASLAVKSDCTCADVDITKLRDILNSHGALT